MKVLLASAPAALFLFWLVFLAAKVVAIARGDWFVWNAMTATATVVEATLIALLLVKRLRQAAAIMSIAVLGAAMAYHIVAATHRPTGTCGCLGSVKATHLHMIPMTLVGMLLAAATIIGVT